MAEAWEVCAGTSSRGQLGLKRKACEDAQLGARIVAVDVGGGIGFGVAQALRFTQNVGVVRARFHGAEDEVCRCRSRCR